MNSKERVKKTIVGESVDRFPLGLYVVDCDIIEKVIGHKTYVRDKIGQQIALWEGRRKEVVESYKEDTIEFFEKIDCVDLITFKEAPLVPPKDYVPNPPKKISDGLWEDEKGRIFKASRVSNELICVKDPAQKDVDKFTPEMFSIPTETEVQPPDPSIFEACDYIAKHLGKERYIAGISGGITAFTLVGGQEVGLMMYAMKPEIVRAANTRSTIIQNLMDKYFIHPHQDGVLLEQDMGGTNGPLISPAQFRENCLPYLKERIKHIKQFGQQIILHNCGDNRPLMDMFIEAGVQCYQSLQTNAGMELGYLQEKFGERMTFWGGIPLENLIQGTTDDVRKDVREAIRKSSQAKGFILGPSHSIAYGTKYDNFMALLDEYQKFAD